MVLETMTTRNRFIKQLATTFAVGIGAAVVPRAAHALPNCCPTTSDDPICTCQPNETKFRCRCPGNDDYCGGCFGPSQQCFTAPC